MSKLFRWPREYDGKVLIRSPPELGLASPLPQLNVQCPGIDYERLGRCCEKFLVSKMEMTKDGIWRVNTTTPKSMFHGVPGILTDGNVSFPVSRKFQNPFCSSFTKSPSTASSHKADPHMPTSNSGQNKQRLVLGKGVLSPDFFLQAGNPTPPVHHCVQSIPLSYSSLLKCKTP